MESIRSVTRAAGVMDAVRDGGALGARLIDIAGITGLQKSTVHRLLATLVELGWLEQDTATGAFHLGPPMVGFGTVALNRHGLLDVANPHLTAIAEKTEDTAYLSIRSGAEALCIDRVTGSFPIRTLTLRVGDRRPLGIGAGSLALLTWMPDDDIERVLASPASTPGFPARPATSLRTDVAESRQRGFALNHGGIVPGAVGVGVAVQGADGASVAALSVAAVESRMSESRIAEVAAFLRREADLLAIDLAELAPNPTEASVRRLTTDV
jgi:DNA-binding IclR family transcriptional regulator